jgi:hypothetical protein
LSTLEGEENGGDFLSLADVSELVTGILTIFESKSVGNKKERRSKSREASCTHARAFKDPCAYVHLTSLSYFPPAIDRFDEVA